MKRIASFSVNHDFLEKGMYVSRTDGDVITYDIRMKKPNGGDYLSDKEMHTFEHLFATHVRNSEFSGEIVYVGPMGCRTGFYFLTRDSLSREQSLKLVRETLEFVLNFSGEIPGSKRQECGNYLEHDLAGAKAVAADMQKVLAAWSPEKMDYAQQDFSQGAV